MKRSTAKLLRLVLVCALATGTVVLPALSRCVDAAGHDEIELSNADCCADVHRDGGVEPAGSCIGGCLDGRLIVSSLSRTPDGKDAGKAPLAAPSPSAFAGAHHALARRISARAYETPAAARGLWPGSISVLIC